MIMTIGDTVQGSSKGDHTFRKTNKISFNKGLPLGKTVLGKIRGKPGETAQFAEIAQNCSKLFNLLKIAQSWFGRFGWFG